MAILLCAGCRPQAAKDVPSWTRVPEQEIATDFFAEFSHTTNGAGPPCFRYNWKGKVSRKGHREYDVEDPGLVLLSVAADKALPAQGRRGPVPAGVYFPVAIQQNWLGNPEVADESGIAGILELPATWAENAITNTVTDIKVLATCSDVFLYDDETATRKIVFVNYAYTPSDAGQQPEPGMTILRSRKRVVWPYEPGFLAAATNSFTAGDPLFEAARFLLGQISTQTNLAAVPGWATRRSWKLSSHNGSEDMDITLISNRALWSVGQDKIECHVAKDWDGSTLGGVKLSVTEKRGVFDFGDLSAPGITANFRVISATRTNCLIELTGGTEVLVRADHAGVLRRTSNPGDRINLRRDGDCLVMEREFSAGEDEAKSLILTGRADGGKYALRFHRF